MKYANARFILGIDTGNEAMQTPLDVAIALKAVARRLARGYTDGTIQDSNGNTVGSFRFTKDGK